MDAVLSGLSSYLFYETQGNDTLHTQRQEMTVKSTIIIVYLAHANIGKGISFLDRTRNTKRLVCLDVFVAVFWLPASIALRSAFTIVSFVCRFFVYCVFNHDEHLKRSRSKNLALFIIWFCLVLTTKAYYFPHRDQNGRSHIMLLLQNNPNYISSFSFQTKWLKA